MATCECCDPGCGNKENHGVSNDCSKEAHYTLTRLDMVNHPAVDMCNGCAEDALKSGVFGH